MIHHLRPAPLARPTLALSLLALCLAAGCGEDAEKPKPPPEVLPEQPAPEYSGEGHWPAEKRGLAVDFFDASRNEAEAVLGDGDAARRFLGSAGILGSDNDVVGLTESFIEEEFGLLVLNRPWLDWRFERCLSSDEAAMHEPLATGRILADFVEGSGIEFEQLAVNVDLLTPDRRGLLYHDPTCDAYRPAFREAQQRENIIQAFVDLAGMPGIDYITVGVEMNAYESLLQGTQDGNVDDYSNFITLYREVRAAIKDANGDVQVGPGVHWERFRTITVDAVRAERQSKLAEGEEIDEYAVMVEAYRRSVRPLLYDEDGNRVADYLGLSIQPFTAGEPFQGRVPAEDDEAWPEFLAYYRDIPVVAGEGQVPVAFVQIDWPTGTGGNTEAKVRFLSAFKRAVAHVDVAWAAWRRLVNLGTSGDDTGCNNLTAGSIDAFNYKVEYCRSGLLEANGQPLPASAREGERLVDVLTADP
jgi:hypothetical protein